MPLNGIPDHYLVAYGAIGRKVEQFRVYTWQKERVEG